MVRYKDAGRRWIKDCKNTIKTIVMVARFYHSRKGKTEGKKKQTNGSQTEHVRSASEFRFLNRCPVHWRFSGCSFGLEAGMKPVQTQWWLLLCSPGVSMGPYYRHCRNKFQEHIRSSFIRVSVWNSPPPPTKNEKNRKDETSVPFKYVISVWRRNNWIVHWPILARNPRNNRG